MRRPATRGTYDRSRDAADPGLRLPVHPAHRAPRPRAQRSQRDRRGDLPADDIRRMAPIGIILSGGPSSIYEEGAIQPDPWVFSLGVPVLGVCYGQQAMAQLLGGEVEPAGRPRVRRRASSRLTLDCPPVRRHRREAAGLDVARRPRDGLPDGLRDRGAHLERAGGGDGRRRDGASSASSSTPRSTTPSTAARSSTTSSHICGAQRDWTPSSIRRDAVARDPRAGWATAASSWRCPGGVDSSVTALLCREAVGERTVPIFVDTGLLRLDEGDAVERRFARVRPRGRPRQRSRALLAPALSRSRGPGGEASPDRPRVHRGVRGGGSHASRTRTSWRRARSTPTSSSRRRCADRRRRSRPITTSAVSPNGWASRSSNRCATCSRTR